MEKYISSKRKKTLYVGLLDKLVVFLDNQGYSYQFKNNKFYGLPFEVNGMISQEGVKDFMSAKLLRLDQGLSD